MKKIKFQQVLALLALAFALPPLLILLAWVITGVSISEDIVYRGLGSFVISVFALAGAVVAWAEENK